MSSDIDPEIIAVRAMQAAKVQPFDITALPACDGRLLINDSALGLNDGAPAIGGIDTFEIAGGDGRPMRARLYRPDDPAPVDRMTAKQQFGALCGADIEIPTPGAAVQPKRVAPCGSGSPTVTALTAATRRSANVS